MTEPQPEPVNPCAEGAAFCGQHGNTCPTQPEPYTYTDPSDDTLTIGRINNVVSLLAHQGNDTTEIHVLPADVDQVVAAIRTAAGQCPGYETQPNRCTCPCVGCMHNCAAHHPAAGQDQPTTRAAILRERADYYEGVLRDSLSPDSDPRYCTAIRDVVMGLRRVADETAGQDQPTTEGAPLVLPLAQVRFLHETLGRLLPEGDRPHDRRERYAAAMYDTLNVSPIRHPWASLGDLRRIVWHRRADAAMAVADAEQRELRAELSAAYEEANELALHNDATCETVKERDGLLAERDRLRAELVQARSAALLEAADVAEEADGTITRQELRRMAAEAQQAGHPQPEEPTP